MRNVVKVIGVTMAVLSMLLGAAVLTSPKAEAHAVGGSFTHDTIERGTSCPSGFSSLGTSVIFGQSYTGCHPNGYSPVGTDAELCSEAPGAIQVEGVCTYDRARECGERPDFHYQTPSGLCVRPTLILDSELAEHLAEKKALEPKSLDLATLVCIEDDRVQANAQGLAIGDRFNNENVTYEIVTGGSFCSFNCSGGFDVNCDGKLGDFCAAEYDLTRVADVGLCLGVETAAG